MRTHTHKNKRTERQAGRQAGRRAGGHTGITNLVVAFRNFVNAPKKRRHDYGRDLPATEKQLLLWRVHKPG
jgi:hypothetical protein